MADYSFSEMLKRSGVVFIDGSEPIKALQAGLRMASSPSCARARNLSAKMVTSVNEIDAAVQVVVSTFTEMAQLLNDEWLVATAASALNENSLGGEFCKNLRQPTMTKFSHFQTNVHLL